VAGGQQRSFKPDIERQIDARETLIELMQYALPKTFLLTDCIVGQKDHRKIARFVYIRQDVPGVRVIEEGLYGTDLDELRHVVRFVIKKITQAAA